MEEIKVGDKIKILQDYVTCSEFKAGDIVTVEGVTPCLSATHEARGNWLLSYSTRGVGWEKQEDEVPILDDTVVKLTEAYETLLDNKSEGEYNPLIVDKVVDAVRKDLLDRSNVGICKYGTTLDGNYGDLRYWLQHAYEETLDKANYLKRAIMEIDNAESEVKAFAKTKGY